MPRLALFDLDGTLADRANPGDFVRLRDAFDLAVPAAQLWQEYVGLMAAAVTCRPEVLE